MIKYYNEKISPFKRKLGFSMMEVVVVFVMVVIVLFPLFMMKWKTTRQIFDIRKHVVASQIARSILDRYLALPFYDCTEKLEKLKNGFDVMSDPMIGEIAPIEGAGKLLSEYLELTKQFKCQVFWETDNSASPSQISIRVRVAYSWPTTQNEQGAYVEFEGVKIRQ
ncbi:MAG: hypothetical protein HQM10_23365 [Candidatus Riflebacteria bacterium]|nr:hypothetical protein [Candidatus Riflebacteria bacterium]